MKNSITPSHLSCSRSTNRIPAFIAIGVFAFSWPAAAAPITVVDWKSAGVGSPPDREFATGVMSWTSSAKVVVLGGESDPPSPFPDGAPGVSVTEMPGKEGKLRFQLEAKPFSPEAAPAEGWIEFSLMIQEGLRIFFGTGGSAGATLGKDSPFDGSRILNLMLRGGSKSVAFIHNEGEASRSVPLGDIAPVNTPFMLRASWVATPEQVTFTFQINGADLYDNKGNALMVTTPNPKEGSGVNYFAIAGGDLVIGSIVASAAN